MENELKINLNDQEKDLLLQDLCARLPYKVKVKDTYYNDGPATIWLLDLNAQKVRIFADEGYQSIEYIKPYLFPMSSMTEQQKKEFQKLLGIRMLPNYSVIDWLNKNHFDYRGLIPLGLAIDATGLNIY